MLPPKSPKMMSTSLYRYHFAMFLLNHHYNFNSIFGSRNSLRGYHEEEANDEEYNGKYDSSTEIDPDLEERDTVEKINVLYVKTQKHWEEETRERGRGGRCLLFDLGEAPTSRLAVIMIKGVPSPIDSRRSLSKKNTVASEDVKRMALRNKGV
ncbi:hypothetical protein TNCV_299091 [Trichonephila clavipes]|nr:hypothetical protein TNCV_299091 [Trichonephila clavipes]